MSIESIIRENLRTTDITIAQFDPNGHCNANCWYCPVKYEGNPDKFKTNLDHVLVDDILANIRGSKKAKNLEFIYTAHYNEILLYKHFEQLIDSFFKYKFRTMVLTNGTTITKDKVDIINQYRTTITDVAMNIPALEKDDWVKKAGFNESVYKVLIKNLDYAHANLKIPCTILVNCITQHYAGDLLSKGILTTTQKTEFIKQQFKERYPKFKITIVDALVDRAGWLENAGVLKNQRAIITPSKKVIGCDHDANRGSRLYGWLHVNPLGQAFVCCDDYDMKHTFGDLTKHHLDTIWESDKHVQAIIDSFNSMCRKCAHHIIE